jgi:hypothetical protein
VVGFASTVIQHFSTFSSSAMDEAEQQQWVVDLHESLFDDDESKLRRLVLALSKKLSRAQLRTLFERRSPWGLTLQRAAIQLSVGHALEVLLDYDSLNIHDAKVAAIAVRRRSDLLARLIEKGCPLDHRSDYWGLLAVPLVVAGFHGLWSAQRKLLAAGADPNARSWDTSNHQAWCLPVHMTFDPFMVDTLRRYGGDVSAPCASGRTVLYHAVVMPPGGMHHPGGVPARDLRNIATVVGLIDHFAY